MIMVLLAAAAIATTSLPPAAHAATAQATATIRILPAVRLKLDEPANPGAPVARSAVVKLSDGTIRPARLIEFQ